MTVPFMRAYTELLVTDLPQARRARHGRHGGVYPQPQGPAGQRSRADQGEARINYGNQADGFDGTWVAHPDLVPVAREVFHGVLKDRPHQKDKVARGGACHRSEDLLNCQHHQDGHITEAGFRLEHQWQLAVSGCLATGGSGAVGINNLMEDARPRPRSARAQIWQWLHHPTASRLRDGRRVTSETLYRQFLLEENKVGQNPGLGREQHYGSGGVDDGNQVIFDRARHPS
jgi:malate synthase